MSDDLISRQAVIALVENTPYSWDNLTERMKMIWSIQAIPSAARPTGKWVFKSVFPNDKSEFPMGYLVCSVCGSHHTNSEPCNFCDNCGADMRGADE